MRLIAAVAELGSLQHCDCEFDFCSGMDACLCFPLKERSEMDRFPVKGIKLFRKECLLNNI
jgi:hypothetical protein